MKRIVKAASLMLALWLTLCGAAAFSLAATAAESFIWDEDREEITVLKNVGGSYNGDTDTFPWAAYRKRVRKVRFADAVTSVSSAAFSSCTALEEVVTGKNTTVFGGDAFAYCPCLATIVFSCPVARIGQGTVYGTDLWNVTLTDQTKEEFLEIAAKSPYNDGYADECVTYTLVRTVPYEASGDEMTLLTDLNKTSASDYPWYGEKEKTVRLRVAEGVTTIGAHAFDGFDRLEEVLLPSTLTALGDYCFANCASLERIRFDAPVKTVGEGTVCGSDAIRSIVLEGQSERSFKTVAARKKWNLESNGGVKTGYDLASYSVMHTGGKWAGIDALTAAGEKTRACDIGKNGYVSIDDVTKLLNDLAGADLTWAGVYDDANGDGATDIGDVTAVLDFLSAGCMHSLTKVDRAEATCSKEGHKSYYACAYCGEALTGITVLQKKRHTPTVEHTVLPTCVSSGHTKGETCAVCGEVLTEKQILPADGIHTPEVDPARSADCTHDGLSAGSHCAVCGVVLTPQRVVEENHGGHSFEGGVCKKCGLSEVEAAHADDPVPYSGVLTALENGRAPGMPDGVNPAVIGGKFTVFFDFAFKNAGLDLADGTKISYTLIKNGDSTSGVGTLDSGDARIRNSCGYIGVSFPVSVRCAAGDRLTAECAFTDRNGKAYSFKGSFTVTLPMCGVDTSLFADLADDGISTVIDGYEIRQSGVVGQKSYQFTIRLDKWAGNTSPAQIAVCSKLFFDVYPRMHDRFGEKGNSPLSVVLAIENEGYGIAATSGSFVHIHDNWLKEHPLDFDCLTHEYAHVIQNGWNGRYLETSNYIEHFADVCRYLYAFDGGSVNDRGWGLSTVRSQGDRMSAARFHLWYDYFYSTPDNDLLLKFFDVCRNGWIRSGSWDRAWAEIFRGSALEGKSIDEIFEMYRSSDFARLSTLAQVDGASKLQERYGVREKASEIS